MEWCIVVTWLNPQRGIAVHGGYPFQQSAYDAWSSGQFDDMYGLPNDDIEVDVVAVQGRIDRLG